MDREWKPNVEMSPNCPRCGSSHTKFCYYNNYSLTQPRYFCKGCRRYWTKGGSIRNVPVRGGCRKNRRGNNKSLKLSRSLDDLVTKHPYEYDHDHPRSDGDDHDHNHQSSSSSHIDLAAIYANFLNPRPDSKPSGFDEIPPELACEFDPSDFEFTNDQFVYHPDHQSFSSASDHPTPIGPSIFANITDGLPPLPGDDHLEAVFGEILWPDDDAHSFQVNPQPLIGPESHQDPDHVLFCNWSPFQFSR